jgi:hypothetical protein
VSFSFSEPYDFVPSLLAPVSVALSNSSASRSEENLERSIWCTQ